MTITPICYYRVVLSLYVTRLVRILDWAEGDGGEGTEEGWGLKEERGREKGEGKWREGAEDI